MNDICSLFEEYLMNGHFYIPFLLPFGCLPKADEGRMEAEIPIGRLRFDSLAFMVYVLAFAVER